MFLGEAEGSRGVCLVWDMPLTPWGHGHLGAWLTANTEVCGARSKEQWRDGRFTAPDRCPSAGAPRFL
jgi:hypothetical protein